jgi:pyrroline-5-carboxylate reductase
VKQVLVELKPLLSEEKLLVSIAAGIKMQDLQVSQRAFRVNSAFS